MSLDSRRGRSGEGGFEIVRYGRALYARIRRSFLLASAAFGLLLVVFAATVVDAVASGTWSGLIAASGVIIFVVNIIGIGVYRFIAYYWG